MQSRTMGLLAVLLMSAAACGSEAQISGSTGPVAETTIATATTLAPETTVPETIVPETTAAESTSTVASLDERLTATPIDVEARCSEIDCVSIAVTLAGEVVSFDSATQVLTFVDSGQTVAVDSSVVGARGLVTMGPDDVAYLSAVPAPSPMDPVGDLVAIPTSGPYAGQEVARVSGLDQTGDAILIARARGVMQVGCCGNQGRLPRADALLSMPWVTPTGAPSDVVLTEVHLEYPGDDTTVVVRTAPDRSEQRWIVSTPLVGRDMPEAVATGDGGALLFFYDAIGDPGTPAVLYDFRPDGYIDTYELGAYQFAVALHSSRFVITLNDGYVKLTVP